MWIITTKTHRTKEFDRVVEISADFGGGITIVSNFDTDTTSVKHGGIVVEEHPNIRDTEAYTNYLNNKSIELNPNVHEFI